MSVYLFQYSLSLRKLSFFGIYLFYTKLFSNDVHSIIYPSYNHFQVTPQILTSVYIKLITFCFQ